MADVSKPAGLGPGPSTGATALAGPPAPVGVRGWLLALCLMMTAVGPLIALALAIDGWRSSAARLAGFSGLQTAAGLSIAITAASVAYGIHAGVGLWSIRPGAVTTAKRALLFGLAADALTTAIELATAPTSPFGSQWLDRSLLHLIPDLVFFTLCLAYLNKSTRVQRTYALPAH